MDLQIIKSRSRYNKTLQALKRGEITIGFLGGSITEGTDKWPEYIAAWIIERFPGVRINFENAAIGATGSALAVFRAEKEIIEKNCDLVFIEYAVNDNYILKEQRARSREGLIRKIIKNGNSDLALVYTFFQPMYDDMIKGIIPESISDFELLADYYNIGSVWMGLNALLENQRGWMRWEEWLPDGLHPGSRGSYSYAQSVISFLETELFERFEETTEIDIHNKKVPEPVNPMNWENTYFVPFKDIKLQGPWTIRRCENTRWIEKMLYTCAPGSKLSFSFKGRGLVLGFDFGKAAADFRYRLDSGDWTDVAMQRFDWCPDKGWFTTHIIGDEFENVTHDIELEVIHGNNDQCKGTNFGLAFAGVIQ